MLRILTTLFFLLPAFATALGQDPAGTQKAEDVYKNIQLFRGMPASRIPVIMETFNKVLGVECAHCHIEDQWEKEDKPQFSTARKMMRMVVGLGNNQLKELGGVTCWSCHRGQTKPSRFPGQRLDEEIARWPQELADSTENVKLSMTVFSVSLGVGCDHCHTGNEWKSDAKKPMQTSRLMLSLFNEFPKYIPEQGGRMQCWTCHKGSTKPERNPPR